MTPTLPERVSAAVAEARKRYSVIEIAEMCDVSKQSVYDWQKKKTINLKGETLVGLSDASGFTAKWIISGKGPRDTALPPDEQTILEAFRLFGDEMRESWLDAARTRLEKEAAKMSAQRKQA